jgi:hypothetical protein
MTDEKKNTDGTEEAKAKKTANRMTEEEILQDYPHAKPGTLVFLGAEQKQAVKIVCTEEGCEKERTVRTSDLWQVRRCDACTRKARRARAKQRRAEKKAEREAEEGQAG